MKGFGWADDLWWNYTTVKEVLLDYTSAAARRHGVDEL
jgi:hypothetical protein